MLRLLFKAIKGAKMAILFCDPKVAGHIILAEVIAEGLTQFSLPLQRGSQIAIFDFRQVIRNLKKESILRTAEF